MQKLQSIENNSSNTFTSSKVQKNLRTETTISTTFPTKKKVCCDLKKFSHHVSVPSNFVSIGHLHSRLGIFCGLGDRRGCSTQLRAGISCVSCWLQSLNLPRDFFQNGGFSPKKHPLKNRVFHYFHHPFWGTPIFGNTHTF